MIDFLSEGIVEINKVYMHPIWADTHLHPAQNKLSLLYIYDIEAETEFVININNVDYHKSELSNFTFKSDEIYVYGKKSLLNLVQYPNTYEASLVKYLKVNEALKPFDTSAHTFYQRKFHKMKWVNNIVPITKHIESIRKTRDEFLQYYDVGGEIEKSVKKFDNFYIEQLSKVEKSGIWTESGMEWTQYHPFTLTSRPSNNFGGINYAALNKENGSRARFVSRFDGGRLIQFDYDAYHPRIIGKMVDEPIPLDISGHQALADMYGVSYNDSKAITFRQLYGGVQDEYLHIPLFKKVSHKIDRLWVEFMRNGYVSTPMGRKLFKSNLRDMNANKLFNYILQATETELNMVILAKVMEFLKDMKSKMVLYTYDSYLLDMHPTEISVINDLKILIESNDFPTKIEEGVRYSEMRNVDTTKTIKI